MNCDNIHLNTFKWKYIENSNNGWDEIRIGTSIHQNR